ncbi:MAG: DMT family transporter [bacterium]|nr:DMT family transporter [bacterium]
MPWQFFIGIYFIFAVGHSVFTRWYSQKSALSSKLIAALTFGLGVFPLGLLIGLLGDNRVINWDVNTIILLTIIGVFIAIFGWSSFASKRLVSVTTYLTLFQLYVVVVIVAGWLILGETLRGGQITGGLLLLTGAYLAIYSVKRKSQHKNTLKGSVLAGIAGLSLGVVIVAEKAALDKISLSAYFIIGYGVQAFSTLLLAAPEFNKQPPPKFTRFEVTGTIVCGILAGMSGYTYIMALTKVDNVSLVILLTTFQLPLSIIASHFILKEKDNGLLLIGASLISFIGLILLAK